MSLNSATEYADSLAKQFRDRTVSGFPFGVFCQDCGSTYTDMDEVPDDCPKSELVPADAYDFIADVLDINYVVDSSKSYMGAKLLITFGGPNAWIDTKSGYLKIEWYSEPVYRKLPDDFISELDEALHELFVTA